MQSLESLGHEIELDDEAIQRQAPGRFVNYDAIKRKSSHIGLATERGIICKSKPRCPEKAIYEFLSLEVWNYLLKSYSAHNSLKFRSPAPLGIHSLNSSNPEVLMEFINGYELLRFNQLRRKLPIYIDGLDEPLRVYPAFAMHLGALNRLKEVEKLLHSDYDGRHILFSPAGNVFIGVVDLENSRIDEEELVSKESARSLNELLKKASSSDDVRVLNSWYSKGRESLKVPEGVPQLERVLEGVKRKHDVNFDFRNLALNGFHLI